jgi:regulator of replication initiation timing
MMTASRANAHAMNETRTTAMKNESKRPSVTELEEILAREGELAIELLPNGEVRARDVSEVSPRSSGGAPTEPRVLSTEDVAWIDDTARANDGLYYAQSAELIKSHETLRTQVSALRQEAAARPKSSEPNVVRLEQLVSRIERYCDTHPADEAALRREVAYLGTIAVNVDTLRHTLAAARQEAETLTRQRDAAIREISVIAREAETLRKQLGEAVQAADDANQEEAFVRRALDSQALDYEALSREAETLRGQLETLTDDFAQAEESRRVNSALYERALRERDDARSKRDAAVATLQTIGAAGGLCPQLAVTKPRKVGGAE